jgi:hypothetical protein
VQAKAEEIFYVVVSFSALLRRKNQCGVNVSAQHCVQLTPLARPVGWARFQHLCDAASRAGFDACQRRT